MIENNNLRNNVSFILIYEGICSVKCKFFANTFKRNYRPLNPAHFIPYILPLCRIKKVFMPRWLWFVSELS